MGKLITLDAYFNQIGRELYPDDWSDETVYYHSERKKDFKHLEERANEIYGLAINRIWKEGKVKISVRLEQEYLDLNHIVIEEFYFAQSICIDKKGDHYSCAVELFDKEKRGRRIEFNYNLVDRLIHHGVKELPAERALSNRGAS